MHFHENGWDPEIAKHYFEDYGIAPYLPTSNVYHRNSADEGMAFLENTLNENPLSEGAQSILGELDDEVPF